MKPRRCPCGYLIYRDARSGVWRHYYSDSEFCYPSLAHLEAWGATATATPEEGP